ncbi:MAG: carboxypeptidase-like regulatory domain-containing protein [Chitinophagaceae bacterium]
MEIPRKRIPWIKYFFQFALPAFLMSSKAVAQGGVRMLTGDTTITPLKGKVRAPLTCSVGGTEIKEGINGRVVDEQNNPVAYASVMIKGTKFGTQADSTGSFSINAGSFEQDLTLEVSSTGFESKEIPVYINSIAELFSVQLKDKSALPEVVLISNVITRGMVVLGGARSSVQKISYKSKVPDPPVALLDVKVYPNPVLSNATISIKCGKIEEDNYSIQLFNLTGQVIMQKEIWIDKNAGIFDLQVPSAAAGNYFIRIFNKQSGKSFTEKLIIQ